MKTFSKLIIVFLLTIFASGNYTYALENNSQQEGGIQVSVDKHEPTTREEAISFFGSLIDEIPNSYKYIQVKYTDVTKGSKLEDALKKFIYLDRFPNTSIDIKKDVEIDAFEFYALAKQFLILDIHPTADALSGHIVTNDDLIYIRNAYYLIGEFQEYPEPEIIYAEGTLGEKGLILEDVLNTLINYHYDKAELDREELLYAAIQGLASATGDQHTAFFPPTESQSFLDGLAGEFEGIGAYVEMPSPGVVRIVSPIQGSPAELAGIKGGDIVTKVEDKEVTEKNSLDEVTSWIKGPANSEVTITILRNETEELIFTLKREKIIVNSIETEIYDRGTMYIQITGFNLGVAEELGKVLEDIKNNSSYRKIIFDLRNNGGGYLDEVLKILSELVPEGEETAEIKYQYANKPYFSDGPQIIDLSKYQVYILQNTGTASASEIFIGTLNDYFDNIVTIGEKTFGKGSMQEVQQYVDGSMLKVTTAKWFTGGSDTGIDGVGIEPDVQLELDLEAYNEGIDNQLEEALKR